jgi:hypothetical protein
MAPSANNNALAEKRNQTNKVCVRHRLAPHADIYSFRRSYGLLVQLIVIKEPGEKTKVIRIDVPPPRKEEKASK